MGLEVQAFESQPGSGALASGCRRTAPISLCPTGFPAGSPARGQQCRENMKPTSAAISAIFSGCFRIFCTPPLIKRNTVADPPPAIPVITDGASSPTTYPTAHAGNRKKQSTTALEKLCTVRANSDGAIKQAGRKPIRLASPAQFRAPRLQFARSSWTTSVRNRLLVRLPLNQADVSGSALLGQRNENQGRNATAILEWVINQRVLCLPNGDRATT